VIGVYSTLTRVYESFGRTTAVPDRMASAIRKKGSWRPGKKTAPAILVEKHNVIKGTYKSN